MTTTTTPLDETLAYLAQQVTKAETQARALMDAANVLAATDGRPPKYVIFATQPPCPKCEALTDALGDIDHDESDPVARMDKLLQAAQEGSQAAVALALALLGRELKDAQELICEVWDLLGYQPGSGKALTEIVQALQQTQTEHCHILRTLPKGILDRMAGRPLGEIVAAVVKDCAEALRTQADGLADLANRAEAARQAIPESIREAAPKASLADMIRTLVGWWEKQAEGFKTMIDAIPEDRRTVNPVADVVALAQERAHVLAEIPEGMRIDNDLRASVSHLADMYESISQHADVLTKEVATLRNAVAAASTSGPIPSTPAPKPAPRRGRKAGGKLGDVVRKVRAGCGAFNIARHLGMSVKEVEEAITLAKDRGLLDAPRVVGQAAEQVEAAKAKAENKEPAPPVAAPKPEDYQATIPVPELAGKDAFTEKVEQALPPAPSATTNGRVQAANRQQLKAEIALQQAGNKQRQARLITTTNKGHSHEAIVDFFGDGHTVADKSGHVHRVLRFMVGNAHSHGHDLAVRS